MSLEEEFSIYARAGIYAFIFVLGLFGNVFIILFFTFKMKHAPAFRWFVIHLAIADGIFATVDPVQNLNFLLKGKREGGLISCQLFNYLGPITVNVSALILCVMGYERYRAICHPFWTRFSTKKIHCMVGFIWVFCIAIRIPSITNLTLTEDGQCFEIAKPYENVIMAFVFLLVESIIPIIVLSFFFSQIYVTLKGRRTFLCDAKNRTSFMRHVGLAASTSCPNVFQLQVEDHRFWLRRAVLYLNGTEQEKHMQCLFKSDKNSETRVQEPEKTNNHHFHFPHHLHLKEFISRHSFIGNDALNFGIKDKKDRQIVWALFLTIVLFVLTTLPYNVYYCVVVYLSAYFHHLIFDENMRPKTGLVAGHAWLGILFQSGCITNMFVYGGKFPQFRHQMYVWFKRIKRKVSDTRSINQVRNFAFRRTKLISVSE